MLDLLRDADVSLNPTSGEGFGLIPLEHAATGLYTAVTNFSGCKEYLSDLAPNMQGIPWDRKPSYFNSLGGDFGYDAAPRIDFLYAFIEWCAKNREKVRERGLRAARAIRERWTWKRAVEQIKEVLKIYESA